MHQICCPLTLRRLITSPKKKTNIRITACNIEQKSQIKYLGVFIDEHLKWDAQLQHINKKITKNIGILFKLRHYVPISTLKQLYYTLIYPYLTYGLMSWGTAYQTKLKSKEVKITVFAASSLQIKEKVPHRTLHY